MAIARINPKNHGAHAALSRMARLFEVEAVEHPDSLADLAFPNGLLAMEGSYSTMAENWNALVDVAETALAEAKAARQAAEEARSAPFG